MLNSVRSPLRYALVLAVGIAGGALVERGHLDRFLIGSVPQPSHARTVLATQFSVSGSGDQGRKFTVGEPSLVEVQIEGRSDTGQAPEIVVRSGHTWRQPKTTIRETGLISVPAGESVIAFIPPMDEAFSGSVKVTATPVN